MIIGVDVQYYRLRPADWEDRLRKLRAAHCNTLTFYVPWRFHQVAPGRFDFTSLVDYIQLAERLGFDLIAKPGPFVHSELNIGGLPDIASPSFNPAIQPVLRHDGTPLRWSYDDALLPSSEDPRFDAMAREWLAAVGKVLREHARRLIGIQLNDETLYCTSNSPPWDLGYEVRPGPAKRPITSESEARALVEWGEFQWRIRRDSYARYKRYIGLEHVRHYSNIAGMTPPIEENVPGKPKEEKAPDPYAALYPEWWLAQNRPEADLDVHDHGIVSWLGVAAYDEAVFDRWINTARRHRGLNVEENWGFATLYHRYSKHPLVPFFQTCASIAGGCTGYVVFCGCNHDYWTDDLDRVTRRQHPTFPSDAPIAADGSLTPMYDAMALLNGWFAREGDDFLRTEMRADLTWLVYPPYAAISGWVPDERSWSVPGWSIPRCGTLLERAANALRREGYVLDVVDVTAASIEGRPVCVFPRGPFLDDDTRRKLDAYVANGGVLLEDARPPHPPRLRFSPGMRAFLYERGDDRYIWFFNFDVAPGPHLKTVEFEGRTLRLALGSKTCGVVHLRGDRIRSALWKGRNEVEGVETEIVAEFGNSTVRARGDHLAFYD